LRLLSPKRQQRYYEFDQMVKCRDLIQAPNIAAPRQMNFADGIACGESQKASDISGFIIGA
jgi:hypothetical protein